MSGLILVTGASSGIGNACVQLLLERRRRVLALGRRRPREVDPACWIELDLLDQPAVAAWLAAPETRELRFDGLLLSAGVEEVETPGVYDDEIWRRTLRVNLEAPAQLTEGLADQVVDGGAIVFIGSIAAVVGSTVSPSYAASKGGLEAFSRSIHLRLGGRGVRCNVLRAGPTRTPLFHKLALDSGEAASDPRLINDPREVAEAAFFLLEAPASAVAGGILTVDQGRTGNR